MTSPFLASFICKTPIALISLLDERRQWFKFRLGLDLAETPIEHSFCAHAIRQPDVFVVGDTASDARFSHNPLVTSDPHIRFYAGAPLVTSEGVPLGTLCVIDRMPRDLSPEQRSALAALARHAVVQMEMRHTMDLLMEAIEQKNAAWSEVETLKSLLPICAYCKKVRDDEDYWHHVDHYLANHSDVRFSHGICPECFAKMMNQDFGDGKTGSPQG